MGGPRFQRPCRDPGTAPYPLKNGASVFRADPLQAYLCSLITALPPLELHVFTAPSLHTRSLCALAVGSAPEGLIPRSYLGMANSSPTRSPTLRTSRYFSVLHSSSRVVSFLTGQTRIDASKDFFSPARGSGPHTYQGRFSLGGLGNNPSTWFGLPS